MHENAIVLFLTGLVSLSIFFYKRRFKSALAPLPPGPRGLPLLGNALHLPPSRPWETFAQWGKIYGGILYLNAFGKSIVVLNDVNYAFDILDKKSRIYNDRPKMMMAGQLVGWGEGPALIHFCDTWVEYRKLFSQFMGTRAKVYAFDSVLQEETNVLLKRILNKSEDWTEHSRKFTGAIVLRLAYGYQTKNDDDDALVKLVNDAMDQFSETVTSGAFLVDIFPLLQYVPEWFPGAEWKRKASRYRNTLREMLNVPYDWAKEQIASGAARPCFVSSLLGGEKRTAKEEHILKWAAAGIYSGGADTTAAGIESFFLAMTVQTSHQKIAHAEIDSVVGQDRLPTLADRARLPYFEALLTEVLRTHQFIPLGLPHVAIEDDVHDGYFIPKGSMVITNNWQYCKDPNIYKSPDLFSPERFLATEAHTSETDPRNFMFGFGRRTCPGVHLADASLWLACVSILATFDICPVMKEGKPIFPSGKYMDGSISHPEPFECIIKPRSEATATLIQVL
ncbi:cytochrome P450 [Collybia nuda]|uniref:Cytochrome P450 n=1 Tax=Collybia nuda TaxID=64659 RepID=A0A9P5Y758_9AGAR|nr:cytochrome P450 [Collybia nuda]